MLNPEVVLCGLCAFRKQYHKTFHRLIKNVTNIQKLCIQPFLETIISESVKRQSRENSSRIKKYSWNYIGSREKVNLFILLGRLSFSRFSLAIKTLATDVSLGEEKKSFILIFSFGTMAVNCWKIHHFSLIERIIDEFLA